MKSKLLKLLLMALRSFLYGVSALAIFFTSINAEEISAQRINSVQKVFIDVQLEDATLSDAFLLKIMS